MSPGLSESKQEKSGAKWLLEKALPSSLILSLPEYLTNLSLSDLQQSFLENRVVNSKFNGDATTIVTAVSCLVKIRKLIRLTNPVSTLTELDVQQKKRLCVAVTVITRTMEKKCYYRRENEINKFRKIRQ